MAKDLNKQHVKRLIADMLTVLCDRRVPTFDEKQPYVCRDRMERRCPAGDAWFTLQPDCHPTCPLHVRNHNVACDSGCCRVTDGVKTWMCHFEGYGKADKEQE